MRGVGPSYSNETRSGNSTLGVLLMTGALPADVPGADEVEAPATFAAATEEV